MRQKSLAVAAVLLLTACSTPPEPAPDPSVPAQEPTTADPGTATPETPAPDTSEPAAPTNSADSAPEGEPAAEGWVAPEACSSLQLEAGGVLDGVGLGGCVSTALRSFGSGREYITGPDFVGSVDFTYTPELSLRAEMDSGGELMTVVIAEGDVWMNMGGEMVRGDESGDPTAQLVASLGELYRFFSSPEVTADLIAASPEWVVADELEERELPNGQVVAAHRIEAAAPFAWQEVPVDAYTVWFAPDWTPVGAQGTSTMMGVTATTLQEFYDLGADITIAPPA
ncbi:hypothetical protein GCM10028820_28170 [Tessaracoccus terricola]